MRKIKGCGGVMLSAALPVMIFLLVFMGEKVTQGNYTLLVSDLNGQYVNFFLYFKEALEKGDNLFYSFSMLLGGDTLSLLGYYLLSPFNLLVLLWPASKIASCIFVIVAAKVGMTGITAYLYFTRKRGIQLSSLVFSTTYAVSGYLFAYFMNIMWLDALYMLPVVIMGLELLVERKKKAVYIISLSVSIMICYYTGYMTAGFCLLYFVYLQLREKLTAKEYLINIGNFVWTSMLAGLLSAGVLIPVLLSQMGNRQAQTEVEYGMLHSVSEVVSKFFSGAYDGTQFSTGAPHVYSGMLILVLVVLLFVSVKKENSRRVFAAGVLLVPIFTSFLIGALDIVWHGMAMPNSFNHRYAFVFIFALVVLAEEVFTSPAVQVTLPRIILTVVVIEVLAVWILQQGFSWVNQSLFMLDMVVVPVLSIIFFLCRRKQGQIGQELIIVVLLIQMAQLFANGREYVAIHTFDDHSSEGYYSAIKPVIEEIQNEDLGLYRVEKKYFNSANDAMMLSYNGLSHFSSADKSYIRNFMGSLGYNKNYDFWVYYDKGATNAADSLLGVKYITATQSVDGLIERKRIGNQIIYENPYALEIGTVCSAQVKELELTPDTPFVNQEAFYSAMLAQETELFTYYEEPELQLQNLVAGENAGIYVKEQDGLDGILSFTFSAKNENPIYMYLPSVYNPNVHVYVNGEDKGEYLTAYHRGIMELGVFAEGETVLVELYLQGLHAGFSDIQICGIEETVLAEAAGVLKNQGWNVLEHNSGKIKAGVTVEQENSVLFLTIPYSENWKIKVDGVPVKAEKVADALMAVDIIPGEHIIELQYQPKGLLPGGIISLVSLVVLVAVILSEKKQARSMIN